MTKPITTACQTHASVTIPGEWTVEVWRSGGHLLRLHVGDEVHWATVELRSVRGHPYPGDYVLSLYARLRMRIQSCLDDEDRQMPYESDVRDALAWCAEQLRRLA